MRLILTAEETGLLVSEGIFLDSITEMTEDEAIELSEKVYDSEAAYVFQEASLARLFGDLADKIQSQIA